MNMKQKGFLGIDVSKGYADFVLYDADLLGLFNCPIPPMGVGC